MNKKQITAVILAFVILFSFQRLSSVVGEAVAGAFEYGKSDADNVFLNISVHHIVQMVIALIAIFIIY